MRRLGVILVLLACASAAHATETQLWIADTPSDYAKAEARGVLVRPDGSLGLGPRQTRSAVDSLTVIWAVVALKDGSVALAGSGGRIMRWTDAGGVKPWVRLPVGQVLALAADGDGLVAGSGPEGAIYHVGAGGDTALLARTGERYVWGLATAGRGAWFAATGTRGRLMKVEAGKARIVADTEESNLVSLVSDGKGGAFAGGDSRGVVLHARADGVVRAVFDASEDEIRALALGSDGALYAAALSASAVADDEDKEDEKPQPVRSAVSGGHAALYRIVPDSVVTTLWTSPQPFVFALVPAPAPERGVIVATGNRAGLYYVSGANQATQWLSAPEGQITALAVDGRGRVFAAASNPGVLWRLGPDRAQAGELISATLDARRYARFGRIAWHGSAGGGRVTLATRSGNTDPPDTTWSGWESGAAREDGARIVSPSARYLQWKIALDGGEPRVESVDAAWREQNVPPRVEELVVAPQGIGFREGELQPRVEPVTQTLNGGQRVEYSITATGTKNLRGLPAFARGLRTLQWKGSDPNGDPLTYKVEVHAESDAAWIKIGDDLEATSFTWDTNALPDGRYRVRITASDAPGNPVGEGLTSETVSEPFTIDNTPPAVTALDARGDARAVVIAGRAEDGASILVRLEVALDDGDWRTVSPEGGLSDERSLSVHARLDDVEPGEHSVALRAVDLAGNVATRTARVTVPKPR